MKLNHKKVFIVIFLIVLIIVGVVAGVWLSQPNENTNQENSNSTDLIIMDGNAINTNTNDTNVVQNEVSNNVENTATTNNTTNNTTDGETTTQTTPKEDLNSYLEKFSLICYLDSRTKDLEKEIKRNEDYIDIAMAIAKEHNVPGELVNGNQAASVDVIHKILSEIRGRTISTVLETAGVLYSYDATSNQYYFTHSDTRIAHIFEILENTTENGVVNVKYTCCFPSQGQLTSNNFSGLGRYVITMELRENSSYQYSKYRLQNYEFVIE